MFLQTQTPQMEYEVIYIYVHTLLCKQITKAPQTHAKHFEKV